MTKITRLSAAFALAMVLPLAAPGQETEDTQDPNFLERMIENALGGDGREVRIIGLEGPLSADVTIQAIEVSDPQGTWLTIRDVAMSWRRLALLRRRVDIDALTIGSIELLRTPETPPAPPASIEAEPETEDETPAEPFALPELPVSIELDSLGIGRIDLGAPVAGQAASLSVDGAAQLANGEGAVRIDILRLDGPDGVINLNAGFENENRRLYVTLDVEEAQGGLIATLAKFPGAPAVDLAVSGDSPISDFIADINLTTDGEERLAGTVALSQDADATPVVTTIDADIGGDITPLFLPEYRDFFGEDIALAAKVLLNPDTGTTVENLELASRSLNLTGEAAIGPSGLPQLVDLSGRIGTADALPVTLPLSGPITTVNDAFIRLDYDASEGDTFLARIGLLGLRQGDISVGAADLSLDGILEKTDEPLSITGITTQISAQLGNLGVGNEDLNDALSGPVTFDANVAFDPNASTVTVRDLALVSGDLQLDGQVDVTDLSGAMEIAAKAALTTGDLARFAPVAQQPLAGSFDGDLQAAFTAKTGAFGIDLTGLAQDLAIGNPQVDGLLAGRSDLTVVAQRDAGGITLETLDIQNPQLSAQGTGALSSTTAALDLTAELKEANLLAPQLSGPLGLTAEVSGTAPEYVVAVKAGGEAITDQLGDPITLDADLVYEPGPGHLGVPTLSLLAGDLNLQGLADVTGLGDALSLTADLELDTGDLARLAPLAGMPLAGTFSADVTADFVSETGNFHADVTGRGQDVTIGTPQVDQLLAGTTEIDAKARREDGLITIESLKVDNPEVKLSGGGTFTQEEGDLTLTAQLRELGLFVPQLKGPLTLDSTAKGAGSAWTIDLNAQGPDGLHALINGGVAPTDTDLKIDIGLGNLGAFVPQLPGEVTVVGTVSGDGTDYFVDVDTTAPGGIDVALDGRAYGPDGTMDMAVKGDIPLRVADAFISPRSLTGEALIDIQVNGEPGINAISGGVTFDGARFTDPVARLVLENMGLNLALNNGDANLDFRGNLETGGQIRVAGPVNLSAPYNGNIVVTLDSLKLVDPQLYDVDVEGQIALSGALAGGAAITGRIDIPRAEISIPNATGGGGAIPEIVHVGEPATSRNTRKRARILREEEENPGGESSAVAYPLDLVISAPARVFVRGRGLDVEFGGGLEIAGTSANPIPSGRFEIIRGRMDILNRVLIFTEAVITMGGDLVPDLFMVATSEDAPIDARIEIEGPVNDPELTFSSSPELPEDEVLAQLFFGKPVRELSPLEIAGLLSAISTLTGGGGGVFGTIREGLGVDQLNVGSNEDGDTEVTAGKYLTDDVYTDVTVDSQGTSRVQLNYEMTDSFTVRGGFDNKGDTRVGITFERDY